MRITSIAALLALAGSSTGCLLNALASGNDSDSCVDKFTQRLHVEPVDEPLRLTMESCRLDVDACPALCTLALGRYGISGAVTQSCTVSFGDDHATLFVKYTKDTGQCGFVDDVAF